MKTPIALLLLCTLISACKPPAEPVAKIAESQRQALDKAKAAAATLQKSEETTRKKIDEQSE